MEQSYKIYFLDGNLVRRVALFYILKNLLNVLIEDLCILISDFFFLNMLGYHKSYSPWKIPLYTQERMRVKKARKVLV